MRRSLGFYVSFSEVLSESHLLCPHLVLDAERYLRSLTVHFRQRRRAEAVAIKTCAPFGSNSNVSSHMRTSCAKI